MSNINYYVRQVTEKASAWKEKFRLVKLYVCSDDTVRLDKPERNDIDISGTNDLGDPRSSEHLEVVVETNFDEGDFALSFKLPEQEVVGLLKKMGWVYQGTPAYVCRSERSPDGEPRCTVLLRTNGKLTEDKLTGYFKLEDKMRVEHITRDGSGLLAIPDFGECECLGWSCSENLLRPSITVDDHSVDFESLEMYLKAKVGDDTTPITRKMFGDKWEIALVKLADFGKGDTHIEFRLVNRARYEKSKQKSQSSWER